MENINEVTKILGDHNAGNEARVKARSVLEDLQMAAEKAIRNHQREVNFETKEYTVELTVSKYRDGIEDDENELFVPDYQRDFVWNKKKQSRLIESILIGLPVPYIFIADVDESEEAALDLGGRTEIVDGSQRVRTLDAFINGGLKLQDLELLPELNGFTYSVLPRQRQRRLNRSPIRIIELGTCTESTRRDLFERINTGSDILLDMEVRKGSQAADSGLYRDLIVPCSKSETFIENAPLSEAKVKRGERQEFALRFFAYLEKYTDFDHSVRDFLNEFLRSRKDMSSEEIGLLMSEFNKTMDFAKRYLPNGFKKSANAKSTPRVRFESLAVGIALALREDPSVRPENIDEWLFSDEFKYQTTSDGANSRPRVIQRIEFVKDKILNG